MIFFSHPRSRLLCPPFPWQLSITHDGSTRPVFLITVSWNDTADDKDISDAATAALKEVERYTQEVGAANDWIYLNYAGRTQDVIKSYGPQNVAKLRAASKKYDPEQVFQKLVPGGYKIPPEEEQEQEEEEEGGYTDESGYDY